MKHAIVIGAGVGGLAASINMARAGVKVTLFERGPTVGGKLRELDVGGHKFLGGPTSIPVIVAGAKNAAISMVVRIFGEWSGTATQIKPIEAERGRVPAPVTR